MRIRCIPKAFIRSKRRTSATTPGGEPQKRVTGAAGRDQDPPELSETVSNGPFKLDIYIIGNMLKNEFSDVTIPPSVVVRKAHCPTEIDQR